MSKTKNWLKSLEFNIDWLNGVFEFDGTIKDFFSDISLFDDRLKADNWVLASAGKYNYKTCYRLNDQSTFIVGFNASDENLDKPLLKEQLKENEFNSGIFVSISGDGLRYLQQHSNTLPSLIKYFYNLGFRCSRFDVNCDVFDKKNPLVPMIIESFRWALVRKKGEHGLVTKVQRRNSNFIIYEGKDIYHTKYGKPTTFYNVTLGNHSTRFGMFRCYNKFIELKEGRLKSIGDHILSAKGDPDYWYRLEYELHKENAADIFNAFASGKINLEGAFYAAADKIFTPVIQGSIGSKISDVSEVDKIWLEFLNYLSVFI